MKLRAAKRGENIVLRYAGSKHISLEEMREKMEQYETVIIITKREDEKTQKEGMVYFATESEAKSR